MQILSGNNFDNMTFDKIAPATDQLCYMLLLPIHDVVVYNMEIGASMVMQYRTVGAHDMAHPIGATGESGTKGYLRKANVEAMLAHFDKPGNV